jgi:hypothetical protein
VPSSDGTFSIQSTFNQQSIGFLGPLTQGAKVAAVDPSFAKYWVFQRTGTDDFMYDRTVLFWGCDSISLTAFDRISVPGSPFVIGMTTPVSGAPVQMLGQTGGPNQVWLFQEGDSP